MNLTGIIERLRYQRGDNPKIRIRFRRVNQKEWPGRVLI
jgi:hypothetical protein